MVFILSYRGYLLGHLPGLLLQLQDDLIAGAAVGASSGGAVLLPALQTDPAEVVLALARERQPAESVTSGAHRFITRGHAHTHLGTLHVVAALRLLNGRLAVGARLGVGQQPQAICRVLVGLANTSHCTERHAHAQLCALNAGEADVQVQTYALRASSR